MTNNVHILHIDENIVDLEALDTLSEFIDEQIDQFLHSINLLDSNLDINVDLENLVCEPADGPLPQPYTKNEIHKTLDLKIKNSRRKTKFEITTPLFVTKPQYLTTSA